MTLTTTSPTITYEMMQQVMEDVSAANPYDRSELVMSARDHTIFIHVFPTNTNAILESADGETYEMTVATPGQPLQDMHVRIGQIGTAIFTGKIPRHPDFRVCETEGTRGA